MKNYLTNFRKLFAKYKEVIILSLIIITGLLIYKDLWQTYFFQDDWLILRIVKNTNWSELPGFLIPSPEVQFYRPLSVQLFYFFLWRLFGLNIIAFHVLPMMVYTGSILLFFKLTKFFLQNQRLRSIASFLFATSAVFYDSLNWIANFSYLALLFITLLILYLFLKLPATKTKVLNLAGLTIIGLLVNEFIFVVPILLFLYDILVSKKVMLNLNFYISVFCIMAAYIGLRIIFPSDTSDYPLQFGLNLIHAYRWLALFLLNWPETVKDYFQNLIILDKRFIWTFPLQTMILISNSFLFVLMLGKSVVRYIDISIYRTVKTGKFNLFYWLILGVGLGFAPIIFIPTHVSPHRANISLVFFILFLAVIWEDIFGKRNPSTVIYLFCVTWFISSIVTVSLNDRIHWIKRRSEISLEWQKKISQFNFSKEIQPLYIPTQNQDLIYGLGRGEAVRVWLNNPDLEVFFTQPPQDGQKYLTIN